MILSFCHYHHQNYHHHLHCHFITYIIIVTMVIISCMIIRHYHHFLRNYQYCIPKHCHHNLHR